MSPAEQSKPVVQLARTEIGRRTWTQTGIALQVTFADLQDGSATKRQVHQVLELEESLQRTQVIQKNQIRRSTEGQSQSQSLARLQKVAQQVPFILAFSLLQGQRQCHPKRIQESNVKQKTSRWQPRLSETFPMSRSFRPILQHYRNTDLRHFFQVWTS